jgi:hypothetical protein
MIMLQLYLDDAYLMEADGMGGMYHVYSYALREENHGCILCFKN